jgi:hypothetical protein
MRIILNTESLDYDTHTTFDSTVLHYMAQYVILKYNDTTTTVAQRKFQYEFLTRAAYITVGDWEKFVTQQYHIRTRFENIFKCYSKGDFEHSTIPILQYSGALDFENDSYSEKKAMLQYAVSQPIVDWLEVNYYYN